MEKLLQYFIFIPFIGYLLSLLSKKKNEKFISIIAIVTTATQLVFLLYFSIFWLLDGGRPIDFKQVTLLQTPEFDFYIDFLFDKQSVVFLFVGSLLTLLVSIFSKYYIHREEGFKRYFNNVQLFFLGYSIITVAGNFETLFLGWEMIGITSFLLISFYNNRYLPVKNAMKVVSLYRLGDVFLILSMWLSHHLWHGNITFYYFDLNKTHIASVISAHQILALTIGICIFIGSAIKSAMYPFSSWVARAMEGPSSSSAIFYGSLSIHLGVFLLLRTANFWENLLEIKIIIIGVGLFTSIVCNYIAQSQSTVKTQIAYSAITQIGLIFVEIGLGWYNFALIHFIGNAFLRTYQILVSPSVLHYLIHGQLFKSSNKKIKNNSKLTNALYFLSIREFNMDSILFSYFWQPFKHLASKLAFVDNRIFYSFSILLLMLGIYVEINTPTISEFVLNFFVYTFAIIALVSMLISFNERISSIHAWANVILGHVFIMMSVSINSHIDVNYLLMYLASIVLFGLMGFIALFNLKKLTNLVSLDTYHGSGKKHPKLSLLFLISCIGLIGFPISPLYIAIDLLLTYIEKHQYLIMTFVALSLIFIEISLLRIYTRLFCGIPLNAHEPAAFKSS